MGQSTLLHPAHRIDSLYNERMATGMGGVSSLVVGFRISPDNCVDTRDEPMDDPDRGKGELGKSTN